MPYTDEGVPCNLRNHIPVCFCKDQTVVTVCVFKMTHAANICLLRVLTFLYSLTKEPSSCWHLKSAFTFIVTGIHLVFFYAIERPCCHIYVLELDIIFALNVTKSLISAFINSASRRSIICSMTYIILHCVL